jgi:nicotinamidase-related amidase
MPNFTELLTPENSQLIFIDQQPQMAFGVQSIDRQTLKNNVVALAKAATYRPRSRRWKPKAFPDTPTRSCSRCFRSTRSSSAPR